MKTRIFLILALIFLPSVVQAQSDSEAVVAAFDKLIGGIKHASVKEVMDVYWNSPQLSLFNYNGTVTKGWAQVRKNRESSYPEIKDVKLEIRDRATRADGAVDPVRDY